MAVLRVEKILWTTGLTIPVVGALPTIKSMSGAESRENTYPRIDEGYSSLSGTSIGSNKLVLQLSQQEPAFQLVEE